MYQIRHTTHPHELAYSKLHPIKLDGDNVLNRQ